MPAGGRKNDTAGLGFPTVKRSPISLSTASFLDRSFVDRVSREAASAAGDVERLSADGNARAVDIAKSSVTDYSRTSRVSSSISRPFFAETGPKDPILKRREGDPPTAMIDFVDILFSPASAVVDGFSVRLTFSMTRGEQQKTRAVRVFRCDHGRASTSVDLSIVGSGLIATPAGRKNPNQFSTYERMQRERGTLGGLAPIQVDGVQGIRRAGLTGSNVRISTSQDDIIQSLSVRNLKGILPADRAAHVDPSVSLDLKTVARLRTIAPTPATAPGVVGRLFIPKETASRASITTQQGKADTGVLETSSNSIGFREVFFSSTDNLKSRLVGDIVEFNITDQSVIRGNRYSYYVVLVDREMREGRRSDLVSVVVDFSNPPGTPDVIGTTDSRQVMLNISTDGTSKLIEKVEVYRRSGEVGHTASDIVTLGGVDGAVGRATRPPTSLGWVEVAELPVTMLGSTSFTDRQVRHGVTYDYRVYAVDCLGNKSQTPGEISVAVHDPRNPLLLKPLVVTADVDQRTRTVKVSSLVTDERVVGVFIDRRDLTISERAFTNPLHPDTPLIGSRDPKRFRTSDPVMADQRGGWVGYIPVIDGKVEFVDQTARIDHSYQYRAYGVDATGRKTPYAITQPVFVSRRPLVDAPTDLAATVDSTGVKLSWSAPNNPFSADDLLGNRDDLAETSVRNIYQVQRTEVGRVSWDDFPLVDTTELTDQISDLQSPNIRPPYPKVGRSYLYRVAVLQSGNYYSSFSDPIKVDITRTPPQPTAMTVRASDTRVRPTMVVVNWESEGDVERWTIERAVVNNIAAQGIRTSRAIESLGYTEVASITPESSRATSRSVDATRRRDPSVFLSERFFIDRDVSLGNSYFYRIRSWVDGNPSDYSYQGILLSNVAFERRLASILTEDERRQLMKSLEPMVLKSEVIR